LNFEQRLAVERIVEDSYGPCPFVIFGPPGTGKTSTIVEAILQILQHRPDARILATAPSSSAADTILKRLIPHLMPKDLFRLCNPARTFAEVADDMLPYTASQSGYFTFPDKTKLMAFRVVVCTCFDAAFLVHLGLSNAQYEGTLAGYDDYARATFPIYHSAKPSSPHWTHCLVDECGQATEPEILIPMSVVFRKAPAGGAARAGRPPQLVLCGDHRQLGPRVVSDFAREKGLKRSLLERLHALPVYRDEDGHHGDFSAPFVHLRRNYRSHKSILMIPSQMYYNDSLLPFADDRVTESLLPWHELKGSEFPIAFFGVAGQDAGIGNGDSWYNDDEVAKVVDVVESLLADPAIKVKYEDFGVIAPFREQVRRIRLALRKKGHAAVNVGVVEDYQGMERKIIIISCVRSSQAFLERDMENDMGLVHSEQRFNVAITRAKALLVVVGDPNLLSTVESTWGTFLAFLFRHGCVHDAELPLQ
ncbi:P-loop containing nucleoside triphosphate hydrolase protein, partial [Hyaloraphidium curvatum]